MGHEPAAEHRAAPCPETEREENAREAPASPRPTWPCASASETAASATTTGTNFCTPLPVSHQRALRSVVCGLWTAASHGWQMQVETSL
jgi:hypothetical protein